MPRATVIAVVAVGLGLACGVSEAAGAPPTGVAPADGASGPRLINDQWRILKMATAHGVFTIEIELRDLDAAAAVTRLLVEPLAEDYTEVLVYIYADEHGAGGHPPAKLVQWTADGGYAELEY